MFRFEEAWRTLGDVIVNKEQPVVPRQETFIRWTQPHHGWMVLNSDGAAKGSPGPGGGGGSIRVHTGKLQIVYSVNYGACRAFVQQKYLEWILALSCPNVWAFSKLQIQIDNLPAVQGLTGTKNYGGECTHIIHHYMEIIAEDDWEVEITHCYREGNRAAD